MHIPENKNEVSNYRGIAKLSSIPKVFEQILTNQLSFLLQIIFPLQTNLFEFIVKIFDGFSVGLQTDVIYTDFSKAFDRVNHCLLKKSQLLVLISNFSNG